MAIDMKDIDSVGKEDFSYLNDEDHVCCGFCDFEYSITIDMDEHDLPDGEDCNCSEEDKRVQLRTYIKLCKEDSKKKEEV